MATINLNFSPLSILISAMILSGIFTHGVQAESLMTSFSSTEEHKQDLLSTGRHIHIEANSYAGSTHDLRAQTPATRPRDDEDKNHSVKKRISGDGFGNNFPARLTYDFNFLD